MKKTYCVLFSLLVSGLLFSFMSCSDDDEKQGEAVELILDRTKVALLIDKSIDIDIAIENGNGDYSVISSDDKVATATIAGNVITITATTKEDKANAVIIVRDRMFKRQSIDVEISKMFDLVLNKNEITLEIGVENFDQHEIIIESGNSYYQLELLENGGEFVEIDDSKLEMYGKFTVKAKTKGLAKIKVTDALKKESIVEVLVGDPATIVLEKTSLSFLNLQQKSLVKIESLGDYTITTDKPYVANAKLIGDVIEITSMSNGKAVITIEDSRQQTAILEVTVGSPMYAMNLGTQYFGVASFKDIALFDDEAVKLKQVTYEMTCKLDGYRGLQTFMGLEGKLIMRGKNDDYHATHPIQIAGLGDRIVMESTSSFPINTWINVALVVDCDATTTLEKYKLYINGVQDVLIVNRDEQTHEVVNLAESTDDNKFAIGQATDQSWRAIQGTVSEARIWNVARTEQQIKDNMCSLIEDDPKGLFAHWDFTAGIETDYIQDINRGRYETNLILSQLSNRFKPATVPMSIYVEKGCPN